MLFAAALSLGILSGITESHTQPALLINPWRALDFAALALLFWMMRRMTAVRMTTRFLIAPLLANLIGLAFLRQTSEMCGGTFHVHSAPGNGTSVTASMRFSHIDRPPLGNLNDTILALCANPDVEVHLYYRANE